MCIVHWLKMYKALGFLGKRAMRCRHFYRKKLFSWSYTKPDEMRRFIRKKKTRLRRVVTRLCPSPASAIRRNSDHRGWMSNFSVQLTPPPQPCEQPVVPPMFEPMTTPLAGPCIPSLWLQDLVNRHPRYLRDSRTMTITIIVHVRERWWDKSRIIKNIDCDNSISQRSTSNRHHDPSTESFMWQGLSRNILARTYTQLDWCASVCQADPAWFLLVM